MNTAYTLNLSTIFEDANSDSLTYKVAINGAAAVPADTSYSYTPISAGSYTLEFKANDGTADSADTYTVTLTATAPPPALSHDSGSSYNYYTIKASAGEGGSIFPAGGASYREGQDKGFDVMPNEGYIVWDVLVDGVSVGPVSEYEFENIKKRTHHRGRFCQRRYD